MTDRGYLAYYREEYQPSWWPVRAADVTLEAATLAAAAQLARPYVIESVVVDADVTPRAGRFPFQWRARRVSHREILDSRSTLAV